MALGFGLSSRWEFIGGSLSDSAETQFGADSSRSSSSISEVIPASGAGASIEPFLRDSDLC